MTSISYASSCIMFESGKMILKLSCRQR